MGDAVAEQGGGDTDPGAVYIAERVRAPADQARPLRMPHRQRPKGLMSARTRLPTTHRRSGSKRVAASTTAGGLSACLPGVDLHDGALCLHPRVAADPNTSQTTRLNYPGSYRSAT